MMRMARPRSKKNGVITWWDDVTSEDKRQRLYKYCNQDVKTEMGAKGALRRLTEKERAIYLLDCRINDRGVPIDIALVEAAQGIVDTGTQLANAQISELTGGAVTSVKGHADITDWLVGQGVTNAEGEPVDSVAKPAVAALLEGEGLSDVVREALELRADSARASLAKLKTMKEVVGADNRARGLHLYHAASTGRWGGKYIQTQNFARGSVANVESFIPAVMRQEYDLLNLVEHPLIIVMSMLRSMIAAPDGFDLMAGDYSAVEARVLNWIAGQQDVVDLFSAMDAGDKTRHPYKVMAVRMGRAASPDLVKKPSDDYQAGKAAELGCGYQMGAEKFVRAAWDVYQLRVTDEQSVTAVKAYRQSHPMVVNLWWDTERAVKQAIGTPGVPFKFGAGGMLTAIVAGNYLYIVLPSKRPLVYAAPRVYDSETSWGAMKPTIHYWGIDSNPMARGRWAQLRTYGGHLVENIVQAIARDLLAEAMLRLESHGYPPIMHVHDEAVVEIPTGFGSQQEFEAIMSELPDWAFGCPISAESWRGKRYRK
jgi:DNA polymerase